MVCVADRSHSNREAGAARINCRAPLRSPNQNCMVYVAVRSYSSRTAGAAKMSLQMTLEKSNCELCGIRCNSVTHKHSGKGSENDLTSTLKESKRQLHGICCNRDMLRATRTARRSLQSAIEKSKREGIRSVRSHSNRTARGCDNDLAEHPREVQTPIAWYTL